ncbi:RNA-directed DNA polymerase from mobile element jockey [Trichonephila clavipes]|nr:RNA-directed DNA polymerase from mobile element jockey [Trichonephila clavipes]
MINLYADDTTISATYKNTKSVTAALNKHLALLEKYFNTWKIKINVDKTFALSFTKSRKPVTRPTLYSTPLLWSQSTKYLGVIFDKTRTWKPHIQHARDKFRNAIKSIYPLICRNSNMYLYNKVLLYTAVLRPILSYACPVWSYAAKSSLKILEIAQNSIIRTIGKARMYNKNANIYKAIKVPPSKPTSKISPKKFYENLPNINESNISSLENFTPHDGHKRSRRILLDSYRLVQPTLIFFPVNHQMLIDPPAKFLTHSKLNFSSLLRTNEWTGTLNIDRTYLPNPCTANREDSHSALPSNASALSLPTELRSLQADVTPIFPTDHH